MLYMLEREATDGGNFKNDAEVIRSVYMPDRVDVVLGEKVEVSP